MQVDRKKNFRFSPFISKSVFQRSFLCNDWLLRKKVFAFMEIMPKTNGRLFRANLPSFRSCQFNHLLHAYIYAREIYSSPFECKITQKFRHAQIYFIYFRQKSDFRRIFHKIHHIRQFFHICMAQIKGPFNLYQ